MAPKVVFFCVRATCIPLLANDGSQLILDKPQAYIKWEYKKNGRNITERTAVAPVSSLDKGGGGEE